MALALAQKQQSNQGDGGAAGRGEAAVIWRYQVVSGSDR
jgi:hypothetical protein